MADFAITKPTVGGSSGTWGTELNAALDVLVAHPGIKVVADADAKAAYVPLLGQVILQADTATLYKCANATGPVWEIVGSGASPLTTKGDVYVYGAADARLPVGTNGQVLTADSTQALGVKWADPSSGATPSGDGTDDYNTETLVEGGTAYTVNVSFIEVLVSFWLASVKLYVGATAGSVKVNVRNAGGQLLATKTIASTTGSAWNTFTFASPIYLTAADYLAIEVILGSSQKIYSKNVLYSGTLWKQKNMRVNDFFTGMDWAYTPGIGLVEYDDTP